MKTEKVCWVFVMSELVSVIMAAYNAEQYVEREFDRRIVVEKYLEELGQYNIISVLNL